MTHARALFPLKHLLASEVPLLPCLVSSLVNHGTESLSCSDHSPEAHALPLTSSPPLDGGLRFIAISHSAHATASAQPPSRRPSPSLSQSVACHARRAPPPPTRQIIPTLIKPHPNGIAPHYICVKRWLEEGGSGKRCLHLSLLLHSIRTADPRESGYRHHDTPLECQLRAVFPRRS